MKLNIDWQSAIIAVVAFGIAFYDVNYAFVAGFVAFLVAIIIFTSQLKNSIIKSHSRKLLRYGSCFLLAVSGPAGCAFGTYRTEAALKPVIVELDGYFIKYGKFPETLAELAISVPNCPDPKRKIQYWRTDAKNSYRLTCYTYVFNKHTFDSESRKWIDWD